MSKLNHNKAIYAMLIGMSLLGLIVSTASAQTTIDRPISAPNAPDTGNGVIAGLSTGSVNHSVPIAVPPGTNGLEPSVSLGYSSQAGDSDLLGYGWDLSQSYIEWDIQLQASGNSRFRLYINGSSHDMLNVNGSVWGTEIYSPLRIQRLTGSNEKGTYWQVIDANGTQYRFGYHALESELKCSNRDHITRYYLDEVKDVHGNRIVYHYQENPYPGDKGATYLTSIVYNNDETRRIEFVYENTDRPDYRMQVRQSCMTQYMRRLSKIVTKVNAQVVREYRISYGTLGYMGVLSSVTEYGKDGSALPSWRFEYHGLGTSFLNADSNRPWWNGGPSLDDIHSRQADVDGDNLPDLIREEGDNKDTYYYINEGDDATNGSNPNHGWNPSRQKWYSLGGEINSRVLFEDMTGDMKANFIRAIDRGSYTDWEVYTAAGTNATPIKRYGKTGIDLEDDFVFILDATGDGKADIVHNDPGENHSWKVCSHGGDVWFESCSHWMSGQQDWNIRVRYTSALRFVDVNSDGLVDIVDERNAHDGKIEIHWNTGNGWIYEAEYWPSAFTGSHDKIRFADFNGDNIIDIAHVDHKDFEVYYGTGRGWPYVPHTDPNMVVWSSVIDHFQNQNVLDMTGDGLVDVLQYDHYQNKWFVYRNNGYDPSSGSAPLRLKSITSPYGGRTDIEYIPSTASGAGKIPGSRWLVSKITTRGMPSTITDARAVTTSTLYKYEGGVYDYQAREFWGFQKVTQTHADNTSTTTYFHTDKIRKFHQSRTEIRGASGNLWYAEDLNWSADTVIEGAQYRANLLHIDRFEYDGQANNPRHSRMAFEYDGYGNVTQDIQHGDLAVSGDERFIYFSYVYNTNVNIVNRPYVVEVRDSNDQTILNRTTYYYDGSSTLGAQPSRGLATKVEHWLDTSNTYIAEMMGYDSFGNLISQTDTLGRATIQSYDNSHTFVTSITNPLSQTIFSVYDAGTGNLVSTTDPNGFVTAYEYDVFGRLSKEILPYDSSSLPTKQYVYNIDGTAPEQLTLKVRIQSGQNETVDVITAFDGFGRTLQTRHLSESNQQIVVDVAYDNRGRVKTRSNPYFAPVNATSTAPAVGVPGVVMQYDPLDRVVSQTNPDNTAKSFGYIHGRTEKIDENGHRQAVLTNVLGQITDIFQYIGGQELRSQYKYNGRGSLIEIRDALGNITTFSFDSLGRKTREVDPDRGTRVYFYDGVGNVLRVENGSSGFIAGNTYDRLNRVIAIDYPGTTSDAIMIYDRETVGTLSQTSSSEATRKSFYDQRLRKVKDEVAIRGRTFVTQYTLDSLNNVRSQTYPNAQTASRQYAAGMLTSVDGYGNNFTYSAFRLPTSVTLANGLQATWQFNQQTGRVIQYAVGGQQFGYTYDPVGNVAGVTDSDGYTFAYQYDALDRLASAQEMQASLYNVAYTYDAIDRIMSFSHGAGTATYIYDAVQPHAVDSISGVLIARPTLTSTPSPTPTPPSPPSGENWEVIESFENGINGWGITLGGDNCATAITQANSNATHGNSSAKLNYSYTGGVHFRCYYEHPFNPSQNWTGKRKIMLDFQNNGASLEVGVVLMSGNWVWQEPSNRVQVGSGRTTIEFDLTTNWGNSPIHNSGQVVFLGIFLYPSTSGVGEVFLDNIRLASQAAATPTPTSSEQIVESFENGTNGWGITLGGDNCATTITQANNNATHGTYSAQLSYNYTNGTHFRCYYERPLNPSQNWTGKSKLLLDFWKSGGDVEVGLVLMTGNWVWQEPTNRVLLTEGRNTVEFSLTANWGSSPINDSSNVVFLGIFLYPRTNGPGAVYLDNIRLSAAAPPSETTIESFENGTPGWNISAAADSCATEIAQSTQHATNGSNSARLQYNYTQGVHYRCYYEYPLTPVQNWSRKQKLRLDIWKSGASIEVGVVVMSGNWAWQESPHRVILNEGANMVEFDLTSNNWGGRSLDNLNEVVFIGLFLYPSVNGNGEVYVDNLRIQ